MTERFDADWLALRERFDHAARSVALARRLADALPARRPRLVDLGAGTGSLFRFLAPIIGRGQDWILIDADADVLDDAFGRTAAWARRQGFAATAQGDVLSVATPRGLWRMEARLSDLTQFRSVAETYRRAERSDTGEGVRLAATPSPGASRRPLPQAGEAYGVPEADAVLCSALLDLVSLRWLLNLLDALRASGYLNPGSAAAAEEKVRRLVRRLNVRAGDAEVWLGMLRQILWKLRSER